MKKLQFSLIVAALLTSLALFGWGDSSSIAADGVRSWKDATGKFSVDAELIEVREQSVRLKKNDGSEIEVPISKLSKGDREFLASRKHETAKAEPEVVDASNARPMTDYPRMSVKKLKEESQANFKAFKEKWVGKVIEVEGPIGKFDWGKRFGEGSSFVFVRVGEDDIGMVCKGPDRSFRPWDHYQTNKAGIVRGKITIGNRDKPYLEDAEFVWSEGGATPRITVEEITAAFGADAESTATKFLGKHFVISGKFLRLAGPRDQRRAILRGTDNINFELHYAASEDFEGMAEGDDVCVFGLCEIGGVYLDHEKIGASWCENLPTPMQP